MQQACTTVLVNCTVRTHLHYVLYNGHGTTEICAGSKSFVGGRNLCGSPPLPWTNLPMRPLSYDTESRMSESTQKEYLQPSARPKKKVWLVVVEAKAVLPVIVRLGLGLGRARASCTIWAETESSSAKQIYHVERKKIEQQQQYQYLSPITF